MTSFSGEPILFCDDPKATRAPIGYQ